jgi:hypothetical protein
MIPGGLSLEQAPPLSAPLRFLLAAPLYLVAAGALWLYAGPDACVTRWAPVTMALTHLITLGFISQVMCGALLQVLPVVAGAPVAQVRVVAALAHLGLNTGTLALVAGLLSARPRLMQLAAALLALGIGTIVVACLRALLQARGASSATTVGLRLALAGLGMTLVLGVLLVRALGGAAYPALLPLLAMHVAWGFLGWILALLAAVAYQVVPMFQVTPPYPPRIGRLLLPALLAALVLHSLLVWSEAAATLRALVDGALAALALSFAVATLRLQRLRRRRIADVTVQFWQLGMLCLAVASLLWVATLWLAPLRDDPRLPLALGVLALLGCAVAVTSGMLYKIVPFLIWFHAQARAAGRNAPRSTQDIIAPGAARWHLRLYVASCLLLAGALWAPARLSAPAALMLMLMGGWLARNLFRAVRRLPPAAGTGCANASR